MIHNQFAKSPAKPEQFIPKVRKPLSVEDEAKLGQRLTAPVANSLNRKWQTSEA